MFYAMRMIEMNSLDWDINEMDALMEFLLIGDGIEEEIVMDNTNVVIWTQENCPLCGTVKEFYGEGNYIEKNAAELMSGGMPDAEAMAQLAMQDMQLPLVMVDGNWANVNDIIAEANAA